MVRVAPAWLLGYGGVILLMTMLLNLALLLPRYAYGLILPFMEDSLNLSHFQAGSFFTAMSILGMVGSFTIGTLASRYGSRIIIGVTAIVAGAAVAMLGATSSYPFDLVMSALAGFMTMGCIAPVRGMLPLWFESRNRGMVAGLAAAGGGLSFIVVGALIPWLTGRDPDDGWRHTWYVLGAIMVVAGILSLLFLRDRPSDVGGRRNPAPAWPMEAYKSPVVWLITLLALGSGWVEGLYATFFGVYLEEEGASVDLSALLWMVLGVLGIAGAVLWGNVSDRLGRGPGFSLSFLVVGAGCFLLWLAPVLAGFVGSVVLYGIGFRAAYVICAASAGDYVAPRFSTAAFGLMGVGAGVGSAAGPLIGGHVADVTDAVGWVFVLAAGGAAVAAFGSLVLRRPGAPAES